MQQQGSSVRLAEQQHAGMQHKGQCVVRAAAGQQRTCMGGRQRPSINTQQGKGSAVGPTGVAAWLAGQAGSQASQADPSHQQQKQPAWLVSQPARLVC